MRIYISGKITGLDIEVARGYFEAVEEALLKAGLTPVNPFKILSYEPNKSWKEYMLADIEALMDCDAILMLENWTDSKGAKVEHAIAEKMGMKLYYSKNHNFF